MSQYRIRAGFAIRVDERTVLQGGDFVELDEAGAALHAHKLELFAEQPTAVPEAEPLSDASERKRK